MNHNELPGYRKVRFISAYGETAGLVISETKFRRMNVSGLSRLFPYSEAMKMGKLQYSSLFETWDGAFVYTFHPVKDLPYGSHTTVTVNPHLCPAGWSEVTA